MPTSVDGLCEPMTQEPTVQVTILTLPFDPTTGGFRTEPLDALCRRCELLHVQPAFFTHQETAYWTLVVTHRLRAAPEEAAAGRGMERTTRPASAAVPGGSGAWAPSTVRRPARRSAERSARRPAERRRCRPLPGTPRVAPRGGRRSGHPGFHDSHQPPASRHCAGAPGKPGRAGGNSGQRTQTGPR